MTEANTPTIIPGLTEGRMVHYVLVNGRKGEHRPAVIVRVWDQHTGMSNLQVFTDGRNDLIPEGLMWVGSVNYSENKEPGTWHYIEKA